MGVFTIDKHRSLIASLTLLGKGLLVGLIVVLPGMSGGTLILILGLYENLMRDLARMRILPWLPFILGMAGGMIVSGRIFSWMLGAYTHIILAFLLGCILASVKTVIGKNNQLSFRRSSFLLIGLLAGYFLSGASDFSIGGSVQPDLLFVFVIAALSSAAMILPGVPGSSVLIIAGIYDNVMHALARLDWLVLLVFAAGGFAGAFALSNIFNKLYKRFRGVLSWTFAGLIIGSGRMLLPDNTKNLLTYFLFCVAGFILTWIWEAKLSRSAQDAG